MIYGTAWKKEQTQSLVERAIVLGFRSIDTACQPKHYNEKGVGQGIANALKKLNLDRSQLFVQTKFTPVNGQDPNTIPYNPNDPLEKQVCDSLEISLKNLQTSYIDSLLLHSPIESIQKTLQAYRVLESFVEDGYVKQIGLSNTYDFRFFEYIYDQAKIKPKVLQNRFYAQTNYDNELRIFCLDHDITYQSFWSLTANAHIVNASQTFNLAKKYNKTNEQIFYRFLTQIGIIPLNGTTNEQHMQLDLQIDSFTLQDQEILSLKKLLV